MNIERLHNKFGYKYGEGKGRTFDMMVEALQNSEFYDGTIYIVVPRDKAFAYIHNFQNRASDLGYDFDRINQLAFLINGITYKFISVLTQIPGGLAKDEWFWDNWDFNSENAIVFIDHSIIPNGPYCYESKGIFFEDRVMDGKFYCNVPIMKTSMCFFYRGVKGDNIYGACSLLKCEVEDQCKSCSINDNLDYDPDNY